MSISRGFDCDLFVYTKVGSGSAKWYKVCTVGDMSFEWSKSQISVTNRASSKSRILPGLENWSFSIEVQEGTDVEDKQDGTGFNFAAALLESFENNSPRYYNFGGTLNNGTISGGETELLICTTMSPSAAIDGLYSYSAQLGISAIHADTALTPTNLPSNAPLPNTGGGVTPGETTTTGGDGTGGNDSGTDGDIQTEGNP